MVKKPVILTCLIFALFLGTVLPVLAAMQYWVQGYEYYTGKWAYGTYGYNYVMSSPNIVEQHVSSLYVNQETSPNYMTEVGWFANIPQSGGSPRFFAAWIIDNQYREQLFDYAPLGTNHYYHVARVWSGGGYIDDWVWIIDGVTKKRMDMLGFHRGDSKGSSERGDLADTNWSHFWNLKRRDYTGIWYDWSSHALWGDTDPDYNIRFVSHKEFYVER